MRVKKTYGLITRMLEYYGIPYVPFNLDRDNYQDCVQYLGDLYPKDDTLPEIKTRNRALKTKPERSRDDYMDDRYSY